MRERVLDPRPFDERPPHWQYGRCGWQVHFVWSDRVAMSELRIGPEDVQQNDQKRVGFVSLRGRELTTDEFAHLAGFEFLNTLDLTHTNLNDSFLHDLLKLKALRWLWAGETDLTASAARQLEESTPGLMVFRTGEGAIQDPLGNWVKAGRDWWPKKRQTWWKLW